MSTIDCLDVGRSFPYSQVVPSLSIMRMFAPFFEASGTDWPLLEIHYWTRTITPLFWYCSSFVNQIVIKINSPCIGP